MIDGRLVLIRTNQQCVTLQRKYLPKRVAVVCVCIILQTVRNLSLTAIGSTRPERKSHRSKVVPPRRRRWVKWYLKPSVLIERVSQALIATIKVSNPQHQTPFLPPPSHGRGVTHQYRHWSRHEGGRVRFDDNSRQTTFPVGQ